MDFTKAITLLDARRKCIALLDAQKNGVNKELHSLDDIFL
jgi:hypothetical protein